MSDDRLSDLALQSIALRVNDKRGDHATMMSVLVEDVEAMLAELRKRRAVDLTAEERDELVWLLERIESGQAAMNPEANHVVAVRSALRKTLAGSTVLRVVGNNDGELRTVFLSAEEMEALRAFIESPYIVKTEMVDCDDPQCGDSTWDHYCTSDVRDVEVSRRALAVLSKLTKAGR